AEGRPTCLLISGSQVRALHGSSNKSKQLGPRLCVALTHFTELTAILTATDFRIDYIAKTLSIACRAARCASGTTCPYISAAILVFVLGRKYTNIFVLVPLCLGGAGGPPRMEWSARQHHHER